MSDPEFIRVLVEGPPGPKGDKGDKGDPGDITPELEALRDEVVADTAATHSDKLAADIDVTQTDADRVAADADAVQTAADRLASAGYAISAQNSALAAADALTMVLASANGGPYQDEPTGRAAVLDGQYFWVVGLTPIDNLLLYRRINAGASELRGDYPNSAVVTALSIQVAKVLPVLDIITTYIPTNTRIKPRFIDQTGLPVDYDEKDINNVWHHKSPEVSRLVVMERQGLANFEMMTKHFGRSEVASNDTIVRARRRRDGFTQIGASSSREFRADRLGPIGAGKIWVKGEGLTKAFCISGESPGENDSLTQHGGEGFSWMNTPSIGAPAILKSFDLFSGLKAGTAIASGVVTMNAVLGRGQSTRNGTEGAPALTTVCPSPNHLFMFDIKPSGGIERGVRILGNEQGPNHSDELLKLRSLLQLIPAHESNEAGNGETQSTMEGNQMLQRMGNSHAFTLGVDAIGSAPYEEVKKGTPPFSNGCEFFRRSWAIAKMRDLAFNAFVDWPEQEGNVGDTQSVFYAKLLEHQSDWTAFISALTDGEVANMLMATYGFNNGTNYGLEATEQSLAQLQAATTFPDRFVYATPCYIFPRFAGDGTHYINTSARLGGHYFGRALGNKAAGRDALPLYTASISVVGNAITGTLHLPYNHGIITNVSPLGVTDPGQMGFKLIREDNGVNIPASFIGLTGPNTWSFVANSPPAGVNCELSHAWRGTIGNHGGPTTGARSPINDGCTELDSSGNPYPNHLAPQRFQHIVF